MAKDVVSLIEKLSDEHLALSLMSNLWVDYDYGGISKGRSLKSLILESAMDIMDKDIPPPFDDASIRNVHERDLILEAKRRGYEPPKQLLLFRDIRGVQGKDIAALLMESLYSVHQNQDDEIYQFTEIPTKNASFLLNCPVGSFEPRILIDETQNRCSDRFKSEQSF